MQPCVWLAVIGVTALSACAFGPSAPPPPAVVAAPVAAAPISSPTPELSNLDDDIGAVLVVSWRGTGIPPGVRALLEEGRVGGVLLFASNFGGPTGLKALTDQIRSLASRACLEHPILVMLDEEGGQVNRVMAPFAPPSQLVAGSGGSLHVEALERESAAGLRTLGVGLNLAPVADVRTEPKDMVIGDRSFGSDAATVAPLVSAAVTGLHEGGIGATLKHFPGLGGAAGDPHFAIPTDGESEAKWLQVQAPAFRAGIAAGADAVMTTAVYVPGLGGGTTPAMFSRPVVSRLRTQLGFGGVIVTDSLSMGGVSSLYTLPQATVAALGAGNDLVLLGNGDPAYEASALEAVRTAVISGRLDRVALRTSAQRVNAMRDRWGRPLMRCHATLAI